MIELVLFWLNFVLTKYFSFNFDGGFWGKKKLEIAEQKKVTLSTSQKKIGKIKNFYVRLVFDKYELLFY